jgi:hypothetical protein
MSEADVQEGRAEGMTRDERAEPVRLRPENRVQAVEIEILKRASALRSEERAPKIGFRLVREQVVRGGAA